MGQSFQNPYWVMAGDPPELFKNAGNGTIVSLPFSTPAPNPNPGGICYTQRFATAANGVFDECGTPLFYIAGDWILDEDGQEVGYLLMKDRWVKWDDPNDLLDNSAPNPYATENFETVICEVPARPGHYFIFCSNSSPNGTDIYAYQYDAISKFLFSDPWLIPISYSGDENPLGLPASRFALSKADPERGRSLYVVSWYGLTRVNIWPWVQSNTELAGESVLVYQGFEPCPELELSHDGNRLVWATRSANTSRIHFFDIPINQHSSFEPAPNAMRHISGLEFLPDGRLAVALTWNGPLLQALNGIGYFNSNLSSFYHISNSTLYASGMIELGLSNSAAWSLYGVSSQGIGRVALNGSTAGSLAGTIPLGGVNFISPFGLGVNAYGLPDQVDGESYPYSPCGSGGVDPIESTYQAENPPALQGVSFQPIITTYSYE